MGGCGQSMTVPLCHSFFLTRLLQRGLSMGYSSVRRPAPHGLSGGAVGTGWSRLCLVWGSPSLALLTESAPASPTARTLARKPKPPKNKNFCVDVLAVLHLCESLHTGEGVCDKAMIVTTTKKSPFDLHHPQRQHQGQSDKLGGK